MGIATDMKKMADDIIRDTRIKRGTWPRRDNNVGWTYALNLRQGYLVIAMDCRLPAQLTQVLGKVINKRIVVINDDNHIYLILVASVLTASISALALSSVSWYSASGSES